MSTAVSRTPRNVLARLVEKSGKKVARKQRTTVAQRKAQWEVNLENFNGDELVAKAAGFIDLITLELGSDPVLTEEGAVTVMVQSLARRDFSEFLDVCKDKIKEFVFAHFDALAEAAGAEDPENTNGVLEVPSLGMKFCREGTGYGDPTIDDDVLKHALGDRWEQVYDVQIIPERREETLNQEALWNLVQQDPTLMEKIRDSLQPGAPKPGRLVIRPM